MFGGCVEEITEVEISGAGFCKAFVMVYYDIDCRTQCKFYATYDAIAVGFLGYEIPFGVSSITLSRHYGDTCYNRITVPFRNAAVADEFTLNVVCESDFGENHPAGASLNDIIEFYGASAYEYVQSGYEQGFDWSNSAPDGFDELPRMLVSEGYYPIKKKLSELTMDDTKLLHPLAYLKFIEKPLPGEYIFTITFKSDKKEFIKTVTVNFEEHQ
jgi:hypothetical protein